MHKILQYLYLIFTNKYYHFRLKERNEAQHPDWIHINTRGIGCKSPIGKIGNKQIIRAGGCLHQEGGSWGKLLHEAMHSIGMSRY